MSYHTFFDFTTGLKQPMVVPAGFLKSCLEHVQSVEEALGFEVTQYLENPKYWKSTTPKEGVSNKTLCTVAESHNRWVRWLYHDLEKWCGEKPSSEKTETLTPEDAQTFWHGLRQITVPPERWTTDYYRERMNTLYEVMRGRETDGIDFDEDALTEQQAANVIRLFSEFLDPGDLRLDVPKGHDALYSSDNGEYDWCPEEGAIHEDDTREHGWSCSDENCSIGSTYEYDPEDEENYGCPPSDQVREAMRKREEHQENEA